MCPVNATEGVRTPKWPGLHSRRAHRKKQDVVLSFAGKKARIMRYGDTWTVSKDFPISSWGENYTPFGIN